ncbi:MAG: hypothetical protein ACYDCL_12295 [Myxococcales bacterium]
MGNGERKLSAEERAARAERDRRLQRGLIAKDPEATEQAFGIIRANLGRIAQRRARWLLRADRWEDCRQSVFALIGRWQKEGGDKLREEESLWFLTIRALRQVAQGVQRDVKWARLAFTLDEPPSGEKAKAALEDELARSPLAPRRYANPERQAAAREMVDWLAWAEERLSEDDRRVLEATVAVEHGEADTVGAALGIADGAGRVRKRRLVERLARAAITEGNREMARRLAGRKYADAIEVLFVAEPGAEHRIEELVLLRDGELDTGKKIELEAHVTQCTGCRRTLRTLEAVDDALLALLLLPEPEFDPGSTGGTQPRSRAPKIAGVLAAVAAVTAGLLWFFWPASETPPPPPRPSAPKQRPAPRAHAAPNDQVFSAPAVERGADAGKKKP